MKRRDKSVRSAVLYAVLSVTFAVATVLAALFTATLNGFATIVNIRFQNTPYRIERSGERVEDEFVCDFDSVADLEAHDKTIAERLTGEGCVLMKNNGALPLDKGSKVTCLSQNCADVVACGGGSADIDCDGAEGKLKTFFEEDGKLQVNPTLWEFYTEGAGKSYRRQTGSEEYAVNEVPREKYSKETLDSFAAYSDAAIVVLSRKGSEFSDFCIDGAKDSLDTLDLTAEERDLLSLARENFSKVVVLLNTANPMALGFLDEFDVDACLWVGYVGQYGLAAVADVLTGAVNPSGRLVDTWCLDNGSSPAMVGFYGQDFANADSLPYNGEGTGFFYTTLDGNRHYTTYQEDIYVGYRYYETRYEDVVKGRAGAGDFDYAAAVKYPFGYGLSYTTFSQTIENVEETEDAVTVSVRVKNEGERAGRQVVQVYLQSEYTEEDERLGIEKPSVKLCGFAKTDLLAAGEETEEPLEITIDKSEFYVYDSSVAGTYILEKGNYYLTLADNAHEAVHNILSFTGEGAADKKVAVGEKNAAGVLPTAEGDAAAVLWHGTQTETEEKRNACATGAEVVNRFDIADGSAYGLDITYLSRSDWAGTWPDDPALSASEDMQKDLCPYGSYQPVQSPEEEMPALGRKNGKTLAAYKGVEYGDESWNDLLDQLTFGEMAKLVTLTYHNTAAIGSVGKPATVDDNGPQGFTQSLSGISTTRAAYTDENIMAATFDVALMRETGRCLGNDMLSLSTETSRVCGLYGPAMNTHRTPYGGRNFEYYSEDGFLSGEIAAAEIEGIQSKGVYVYIKHFALNDQETACRCVSTFATEQAVREIYLKPFEKAVTKGHAHAVMNAFARIGCVWTGGYRPLMEDVLRGEWGFDGFVLSDYNMNVDSPFARYVCYTFDIVPALLAGTDGLDCSTDGWYKRLTRSEYKKDAAVVAALKQASHRILYTVVNSAAMNGISESDRIVAVNVHGWQVALTAFDIALGVTTAAFVFLFIRACIRSRKTEPPQKEETPESGEPQK